jgi:hypothetical protein
MYCQCGVRVCYSLANKCKNVNLKGGMDCLVFREPLMEPTLLLQSPHGPLHGLHILLL